MYNYYAKSKNKYHAQKQETADGIVHDSRKEARRWVELRLLQRSGLIRDLERQVPFELIPPQDKERAVKYVADFVYLDDKGIKHVEDVKSPIARKNKEYIIKRKLMIYIHGIKIEEV